MDPLRDDFTQRLARQPSARSVVDSRHEFGLFSTICAEGPAGALR